MAYNTYDVGTNARLSVAFTDQNGNPFNPDPVTISIKAPDGTVSTPTVINDSVGLYHVDVILSQPGNWYYRFLGTTGIPADAQINVLPSPVLDASSCC